MSQVHTRHQLAQGQLDDGSLAACCATCAHFDYGTASCRRLPPAVVPYPVETIGRQHVYHPATYWPDVEATDYCGEWVSD